jgi:3-hydroxyisobutyrate dehydrogenase-like beta-hydroxyacid dehydrogenase
MKLTNNVLCAVALVATSEAITMSGRAGIPADAMLQILNMELVAISRRCTSSRGGVDARDRQQVQPPLSGFDWDLSP